MTANPKQIAMHDAAPQAARNKAASASPAQQ